MTQQEIFQNMTPPEKWEIWPIDCMAFVQPNEGEKISEYIATFHKKSDLLASHSAIHGTYGKGINPESVEEGKKLVIEMWGAMNAKMLLTDILTPDQIKRCQQYFKNSQL
jgi:hypothetical protein